MYKKDAKRIIKQYCKELGLNTRGYKTIDILFKEFGEYTLIFHIGQWREEKELNLFDYDAYIVNSDEKIVYDESNGEMTKAQVLRVYNNFTEPKFY